jgi:hypothetical protein
MKLIAKRYSVLYESAAVFVIALFIHWQAYSMIGTQPLDIATVNNASFLMSIRTHLVTTSNAVSVPQN